MLRPVVGRPPKDSYEREEDEAERLIRQSPKLKPPRRDLQRETVEVKDPDTSEQDRDESLNYKQVGGSCRSTYPPRFSMGNAPDRTAVYHGVAPYPKGHEGFEPYPEWTQVHQRDLGEADFNAILKEAREWLKVPVLTVAVEGMIPDSRFRAALDLAIRNCDEGKYSVGFQPQVYDDLLKKLAFGSGLLQPGEVGKDWTEPLMTIRMAGFSYAVGSMALVFYPLRKPVPFNTDIIKALNGIWVSVTGDDGNDHDVGIHVQHVDYGPGLTRLQEQQGLKSEGVVLMTTPKGSENNTFRAVQQVARRFGFNVEKLPHMRKPEVRRTADTRGGQEPMSNFKLAAKQADNILYRLDKIAATIQDKYESWGMPFEDAKTLVNAVDKIADEVEAGTFGPESLQKRQVEITKAASARKGEVIQREGDEPYMETFKNPMAPVQTDADEPYMAAYKDDQSSAVNHGESTSGRPLAP